MRATFFFFDHMKKLLGSCIVEWVNGLVVIESSLLKKTKQNLKERAPLQRLLFSGGQRRECLYYQVSHPRTGDIKHRQFHLPSYDYRIYDRDPCQSRILVLDL